MKSFRLVSLSATLILMGAGCPQLQQGTQVRNPFLGYTDEYGIATQQGSSQDGGFTGAEQETVFRREMTVRLRNNNPDAQLNTNFLAWVEVGSIRSADQQDALMRSGYSQLTREVRLGTAFTLPVGTFVYDGGGLAGATSILIQPAQAVSDDAAGDSGSTVTTSTSETFTLVTPDVVLITAQPPVSCESIAFFYSDESGPLAGAPLADNLALFGGSTSSGGFKTLAQVSAYQCDPLRPGMFFSTGGGRTQNQFFEGEDVTFDFNPMSNANGDFCIVTVGEVGELLIVTEESSNEQQPGGEQSSGGP